MPTQILLKTKKTPEMLFEGALKRLDYIQWIQDDIEKLENIEPYFFKKTSKIRYLNQTYIFHLVALWQVFVENLIQYGIDEKNVFSNKDANRVENAPRFNVPGTQEIDELFLMVFGINKFSNAWEWPGMSRIHACSILNIILDSRHQIAHKGYTTEQLSRNKNNEYKRHLHNLSWVMEKTLKKYLANELGKNYESSSELHTLKI